jgi:CheY-like chemotaxis protein/HPt (histidine-containing phosphotransfer) domain-containing protein
MAVRAAATVLAGARVATAIACVIAISFAPGAAPAFDAMSLFIVIGLYGVMGAGSLSAAIGGAPQSRAAALAMTAWDCGFLAAMIAGGETGALALPLAVLIMRAMSAGERDRTRLAAMALVVASFVAAAAWSPFWSAHPLVVCALAAMLIAAALAPALQEAVSVATNDSSTEPAPAEPAVAARAPTAEPVAQAAPKRILIVDPLATGRLVLEKVLARAGHTAVGVADAAQAMKMLEGGFAPFDVLLVDGELPDMSGAALTRLYRATETRSSPLRIIGLEAAQTPLLAAAALDAGMDASLPRPVNFGALLDLIAAAPERIAAESAAAQAFRAQEPDKTGEPVAPTPQVSTEDSVPESEAEVVAEGPAIDLRALRDLESLGGPEFVREIVNQFIVDGAGALRNLTRVAVDHDVEMFRDQAHALRSSAANVGARGIYETCLSWRAIAPEQLARDGAAHMRTLNRQFQEATAVLEDYIARLGDDAAGADALPPSHAHISDAA